MNQNFSNAAPDLAFGLPGAKTGPSRRTALKGLVFLAALAACTVAPWLAEAAGRNFTGTWNTRTDKGAEFAMTLSQSGMEVSGTYSHPQYGVGTINGDVKGRTLRFDWNQQYDGGTAFGHGRLALATDGNSFTGTYATDASEPEIADEFQQGLWTGVRLN